MDKTRIRIARPDIIKFFDELPSKVLHHADLARILTEQRAHWRLSSSTNTLAFTRYLIETGSLHRFELPFPPPYKKKSLYSWGLVPIYQVVLGLGSKCYLSHYTAVKIHGLTEQVPTTIYVNEEQRLASWLASPLRQSTIDAAFRRPVRVTKRVADTKGYRVVFLNGKNTANRGVVERSFSGISGEQLGRLRVTNLERTLIDIAVRPVYAGGVAEVLKAFTLARDQLSVNRLAATLKMLAFIYPYHQVIGFYLERAGYPPTAIDWFRKAPRKFDFYLEHGMTNKQYVKAWRLFIPEGF
jgi:hypothetical protein